MSGQQSNIVLPSKETVQAGVFDKKGDQSKAQARVEHYQANPGPVIPGDTSVFEKVPSKDEMMARTEELNKRK